MRSILAPLALAFVVFACGEPAEEPAGGSATDSVAAGTAAETDPGVSEPEGHDHEEGIPNRADEIARDEGSKPQQVMDFLGIDEGDHVADIFAGSGYNTYLLSERVGSSGRVYAQGYSPGLEARVDHGDLADAGNVTLVDSLVDLPEETLDAALVVRGYHLFPDPSDLFDALHEALVPDGVVGVVEVRLGQPTGHDMETHRMGEQTVIEQFTEAGFRYLGESDALRNPEDDHTGFWEGRRHLTDRMLLKFAEPGEASEPTTTARR